MTDKKLTDNEIIKGLIELSLYTGFQEKHIQVLKASLDLINRQKETIETLRKCVEQHHIIRKDSKSPLFLLTEEIRAEAYKEFARRLKEKDFSFCIDAVYDGSGAVKVLEINQIRFNKQIDNLLNEMGSEEE